MKLKKIDLIVEGRGFDIVLCGKKWRICRATGFPKYAMVDLKKRIIYLKPDLTELQLLECLNHEVFHICFPNAFERHVLRFDRNIVKLLWTCGYRRVRLE